MQKRYIGILLSFLAAGGFVWMKRGMNGMSNKTLRLTLAGKIHGPLAPENIAYIPLYHTHFNLWGTLLTENRGPGIARSFSVGEDQRTYRFELDPKARFSNGRPIAAEDVKFSLERLMNVETGGHADATDLLESVEAPSESVVVIKLRKPTPAFRMLVATPEYGIVPREACSESGRIANLAVTSGDYHLESFDEAAQRVRFELNSTSPRATDDSARFVEVTFAQERQKLLSDLKEGKADFVQMIGASFSEVSALPGANSDIEMAYTRPSVSSFLIPNPKLLTSDEIKYLAHLFQSEFSYAQNEPIEVQSEQFLPPKTFGSLDDSEVPVLPNLGSKPLKPLVIRVRGAGQELTDLVATFLKGKGFSVELIERDSKREAHLDAASQGMNASHPEIEMNLAFLSQYAWISASDELKREITSSFAVANDGERAGLIKKISAQILSEGRIIPLTVRSYVHLSRRSRVGVAGITTHDGDLPFALFQLR